MLEDEHVKLNPGFPLAKAAFNKKKTIFTSKLGFKLRKKFVQCYIWSTDLYDTKTLTLQKIGHKCLESFEMWYWRRTEKISLTSQVKNKEILHTVEQERM
jgi:hypothetical protein